MSALAMGFMFGLVGGGHCAVMCGPLAILPVARQSRVAYHTGRLLTYLVLGVIAGTLGTAASMVGLGRLAAIASGLGLVALALLRLQRRQHSPKLSAAIARLFSKAAQHQTRFPRFASLSFGLLNGLLPCGLVYAAVIAAAGFGTLSDAVRFLAAFGVGTIPLLSAAGWAGSAVTRWFPASRQMPGTISLLLLAALLIVRGARAPHVHAEAAADPQFHQHMNVTGQP